MNLHLVPVTKTLAKKDFNCGSQELDRYFRQYAVKNDELSIGKTLVALTDDQRVAGYLTISTAQIDAGIMPEDMRVRLPRYPVPAMRIGKLAVDRCFQGMGVGRWLLAEALKKAVDLSCVVGLFAVLVDAIDEDAGKFYLKYGFIPLSSQPLTMILPMATIKRAIGADI